MTGDPDLISKMIHEQRHHVETTVNHLKTKLREFKVTQSFPLLKMF